MNFLMSLKSELSLFFGELSIESTKNTRPAISLRKRGMKWKKFCWSSTVTRLPALTWSYYARNAKNSVNNYYFAIYRGRDDHGNEILRAQLLLRVKLSLAGSLPRIVYYSDNQLRENNRCINCEYATHASVTITIINVHPMSWLFGIIRQNTNQWQIVSPWLRFQIILIISLYSPISPSPLSLARASSIHLK